VCISYEPAQLTLSVRNTPGGGATAEEGGSGIPGMRARAEALGGTLSAGPLEGGGFMVSAVLPAGDAGQQEAEPE
jgi:signal transduction histidine kinase